MKLIKFLFIFFIFYLIRRFFFIRRTIKTQLHPSDKSFSEAHDETTHQTSIKKTHPNSKHRDIQTDFRVL